MYLTAIYWIVIDEAPIVDMMLVFVLELSKRDERSSVTVVLPDPVALKDTTATGCCDMIGWIVARVIFISPVASLPVVEARILYALPVSLTP